MPRRGIRYTNPVHLEKTSHPSDASARRPYRFNKPNPMADLPQRKWLRHEVPETVPDHNPAFFLTLCCQKHGTNQLANDDIWLSLLETVIHRNQSGVWNCSLFLVMPDHVHGIFQFEGPKKMKETIALAKRTYILNNPVRAKLVEHPTDWSYHYDTLPHLNR